MHNKIATPSVIWLRFIVWGFVACWLCAVLLAWGL